MGLVNCYHCGKEFYKDNRHINENLKLRHHFYCSLSCQSSVKNKRIDLICDNSKCGKKFTKRHSELTLYNYCSRHCAVSVNNKKFPKRKRLIRKCPFCSTSFTKCRKFCSFECKIKSTQIPKEQILEKIKQFYKKHQRIPLKREFKSYSVVRKRFGSWNNAIVAASLKPNPILFAKRQTAKDGHRCDSIAEMLIDNFLSKKQIEHKRSVPYPKGAYTADFKIGGTLIEYFGLAGEHAGYDANKKIKLQLVKKYSLKLVEIYPKDLIQNRLEEILGDLKNNL